MELFPGQGYSAQPRRSLSRHGELEEFAFDPNHAEQLELADEVRGGRLSVRSHVDTAKKIARTKDIRTQHETGTSGGGHAPPFREQEELGRLGFDDHPVYGSIENPGTERAPATQYGDVDFTLKSRAKDRTTILGGDSLMGGEPADISEVESGREPLPEVWADAGHDPSLYIEAQVHAEPGAPENPNTGAPLARVGLDDVHSVDIRHPRGGEFQERAELGQQFQDAGVSTWHQIEQDNYQPPLPYTKEELESQDFHSYRDYRPGGYVDTWERKDSRLMHLNEGRALGQEKMENIGKTTRQVHQQDLRKYLA